MSDTPRTDTTDLYDYQTAVDFSRSLERENTELRECLIAMLSNFGGIACAKTHPYDWDRWRKAAFPALSNAPHQARAVASRAPCSCSASGYDPECKWEGHHHA